jgi:hypothetical protein
LVHAVLTARQAYAMHENQSLWDTAMQCHRLLAAANIPHAVVGGVAVCLHGYRRNTVHLDLLIRKEDARLVRKTFEAEHYVWRTQNAEMQTPSGVAVQFLLTGDRAGAGSAVTLPDPADPQAITEIESLPVLRLAKLIDAKIACGLGNVRRTHKDFADVVELIVQNQLDSSFARQLHKSLRGTFRKLVRMSRGRE